ncbi:aminotransferase class I/II-fold pyridoxal phosphate-dependent enzyme [Cocleimonas sp. KMM 6892]|uniref:serine hydroxymethyltransferase n=1 Tax=unclassified Cocleimonas TaxID=2639732 RepID=UPI002DB8AA6C|nr:MULTISPECIES: aminotransferase class I/II-fold pyridoxal phosphate-dependent enzyme [unclassified Cocleimonas]MEB8431713.1 aminotransferase class I/II-fold pyridoxal phosphate-dependent enzyme [Cocleimonas sp. KMM 6892]MEC4715201.1 aminotransferase class I/II-fold pyridoxal phosphate-dependent enzyme [Cocleimonas sp. KMM 6895]MEC4743985.1 aminotransferase class I/II-fold pyridoxal phosphate-dependent enzyme [Cocleimonas sp. KMM 6896]
MALNKRNWVPEHSEALVQAIAKRTSKEDSNTVFDHIESLTKKNADIHERECFNLNPASNVMNPKAEAFHAKGLGSRASLGYPGDKYEMGLEAIEEIEVIAAELCCEIFDADYAEVRVPSGAIANLYGFMATCKAGDTIIAPPASIAGHVTHHSDGCAGLYGLNTVYAPVNEDGYTVDIEALRELAKEVKPKLITIGSSLNLFEHPIREVREIADEVGAKLMFDAAHQCGIIAGKAWKNPLTEGAHFMTLSTYKSLGGPAGGIIVSNDKDIVERLDAIAYPGMTANFDAAKTAALAVSMLDWREHGEAYAQEMIAVAQAFAKALDAEGIPIYAKDKGFTKSHQFAIIAKEFGGGQTAAKKLRKAGFLASGIGLPIETVEGDMNGLRFGTPELVRWGVTVERIGEIASLVARALRSDNPEEIAPETAKLRKEFDRVHFVND